MFISAVAVVSCSTGPVADQAKSIFEGPQFQLGDQPQLNDKRVSEYLTRLLQPVLRFYGVEDVSVAAMNTDVAQGAASYSDRTIYISKGMLFAILNEAELVALLSHEIGHIKLKHGAEPEKSAAPGMVGEAVEIATGLPVSSEIEAYLEKINYRQFSQKNEQAADEFGVKTAAKLGYDPHAFSDLLERLHVLADRGVLDRIRNLSQGSHKTLAERARHIREFLRSESIQKIGKLGMEDYLGNVRHLATAQTTRSPDPRLGQIQRELSGKKTFQSVKEFLDTMERVRAIAKDLNLLSQLDPPRDWSFAAGDEDDFMMELVKVLRPLWKGYDPDLEQLKGILTSIGRMGVGAVPVIGDAVDFYELVMGRDFFSQEPLTFGERMASALGVMAGSGANWMAVGKRLEMIDEAGKSKEISEIVKATQEAAESPLFGRKGFVKTVKDLKKLPADFVQEQQAKYRPIRDAESYKKLKDLADTIADKKFPDDWATKVTKHQKLEQGWEFVHPDNHRTRVRVMPGEPGHRFPNSREPYVRQLASGQPVDKHGKIVVGKSDDSHIPLKGYQFWEFWKTHGKK